MSYMEDLATDASLIEIRPGDRTRDHLILVMGADGTIDQMEMTCPAEDCIAALGDAVITGRWARGYVNPATLRIEVVGNDKFLKEEVARRLRQPRRQH